MDNLHNSTSGENSLLIILGWLTDIFLLHLQITKLQSVHISTGSTLTPVSVVVCFSTTCLIKKHKPQVSKWNIWYSYSHCIGKFFNFDSLISPCYHELETVMNPSNRDIWPVCKSYKCKDKCVTLIMPYLPNIWTLWDLNIITWYMLPTIYFIKKFVSEDGFENTELTRLISFCISLPVSEAIVES